MRTSVNPLLAIVLGLVILSAVACDRVKESAESAADAATEVVGEALEDAKDAVEESMEEAGEEEAAPSEDVPADGGTVEQVEAGPIWGDQDAEGKCPQVCEDAGGEWNKDWRTTVPGQMSVCDCVMPE